MPQSFQGEEGGLSRAPKGIKMIETSKDKNDYALRAYKKAKSLFWLGEFAVLNRGTKEYGVNVAPSSKIELHHV